MTRRELFGHRSVLHLKSLLDTLPLLGLLDDAAVVSACLSLVEQDLRDYRAWRQSRLADTSDRDEGDSSEDLISS